MQATLALRGWDRNELKTDKQWAAEDFAISIGLLRECPYHGQPFQASRERERLTPKALAASLVDPRDPLVELFAGNTRELMATVERVTSHYGEHCAYCKAAEKDESEFD